MENIDANNQYNFFKLLKKQPDSAQIQAITTKKNAVIAAGAGSGKTEVLAQRFSWLVLTGQAKADEILTLTFTNKAASEMYQRIYDKLNFFANSETNEFFTEKEKKLAQQGLKDFSNAHIQTLDSYCSNIVRQCANRYGISPDFSLASSDGLHDIKEAALKFVFKNQHTPAVKTFAKAGGYQTFANNILAYSINKFTDLTTPENYFTSKIPVQITYLVNALNFYFGETPGFEENFPAQYNFQELIDSFYSELEANYDKKHLEYKIKADELFDFYTDNFKCENYTKEQLQQADFITNLINQFNVFSKMVENLSTMQGKCVKANTKITIIKNKLLPTINAIFEYFKQFEAISSLYSLLDNFLIEVNNSKRSGGNLSFNDVSALALKILIEHKDIRGQEIQSYKKIMIDEFQDNNGKNRDLLYLLSIKEDAEISPDKAIYAQIIQKDEKGNILKDNRDSEKLFFVGDEKQSIYKFRGADVSIFNELTKNGENLLIPMTFNYRSDAELVKAFNGIFANNFGIFKNNDIPEDYEAYYTKDAEKKDQQLPEMNSTNVPIHFKFINTNTIKKMNEENNSPLQKLIPEEEQLAYNIARTIFRIAQEEQKEKQNLADNQSPADNQNQSQNQNGGQAKINWGAFAILDKGRTHRAQITKYLNYFSIPYELDQFNNIFEDGIINDFYNFLRICVYPSDINAFAAYLCSPLAGLQENSVEIILSHLVDGKDYDFIFNPFADFDSEIKQDLSNGEFEKFINARTFYADNKTLVLQQKITKTFDMLWNKAGYKYETMLNEQTALCAEQFDMLFELARKCEENEKSVSWFIDELDLLKENFSQDDSDIDTKEITYPVERTSAVKIMTIHKSKGLQFEHVFLCGCTSYRFKCEKSQVFFNEKSGLSIRPEKGTKNFFVMLDEMLSKKKEIAEFRRLIYVGITRAKKDVYVMGKWNYNPEKKSSSTDELSNESKIFENLVLNHYPDYQNEGITYNQPLPFDFAELIPVSYSEVKTDSVKMNTDEKRNLLIKHAQKYYDNAQIINYECHPVLRLEPSKLGQKDTHQSFGQTSQTEDSLMYERNFENEQASYLSSSAFSPSDFGILAHSYLEAFVNGIAPENFEPPVSYFKDLSEKEIQIKKTECKEYVQNFAQSEIGQTLSVVKEKNLFVKSEWKVKMFYEEALFTGVFDLIFQNEDGTYTIVDYKHYENLNPQDFYSQLNCYRIIASKIFDVPVTSIDCKIWDIKNSTIFQVPVCRQ